MVEPGGQPPGGERRGMSVTNRLLLMAVIYCEYSSMWVLCETTTCRSRQQCIAHRSTGAFSKERTPLCVCTPQALRSTNRALPWKPSVRLLWRVFATTGLQGAQTSVLLHLPCKRLLPFCRMIQHRGYAASMASTAVSSPIRLVVSFAGRSQCRLSAYRRTRSFVRFLLKLVGRPWVDHHFGDEEASCRQTSPLRRPAETGGSKLRFFSVDKSSFSRNTRDKRATWKGGREHVLAVENAGSSFA